MVTLHVCVCLCKLTQIQIDTCASFAAKVCEVYHPCQNSGTCSKRDHLPYYHCDCPQGFTGTHCEKNTGKCTGFRYLQLHSLWNVSDERGRKGVMFCRLCNHSNGNWWTEYGFPFPFLGLLNKLCLVSMSLTQRGCWNMIIGVYCR